MNLIQGPFARKSMAVLAIPKRKIKRFIHRSQYPKECKAILCNSFPKSGTHLLLQVLRALPDAAYYGSFLASVPSVRFKLKTIEKQANLLKHSAPREVIPSHLYFNDTMANIIETHNISHFFIYRDLRDVVVSECFYLSNMAWWHKLSKEFRRCSSIEDRLLLSIRGLPESRCPEYPNLSRRFDNYKNWMASPQCLSIKFEDLLFDNRINELRKIGNHYAKCSKTKIDIDKYIKNADCAIDPESSHTFRNGGRQAWMKYFTPRVEQAFEEIAGQTNRRVGYK